MPFTQAQAAAMSTEEAEARFCACTGDGWDHAPVAGWDGEIPTPPASSNPILDWLKGLLWPWGDYPAGVRHYCSIVEEARAGAGRVGVDATDLSEWADSIVRRVLSSVGQP